MCGIFGIITTGTSEYPEGFYSSAIKKLAILSSSRGKDSSGIVVHPHDKEHIKLVKGDIPVTDLLNNAVVKKTLNCHQDSKNGITAFGHARLVTNGTQLVHDNNQPIVKDNIILVHNGIIVNADKLWENTPDIKRNFQIDSEVIAALLKKELDGKNDLVHACLKTFSCLQGTYSTAMMSDNSDKFILATNNGSLYYYRNNDLLLFASEQYILRELLNSKLFRNSSKEKNIIHLEAGEGIVINRSDLSMIKFGNKNNFNTSNLPSKIIKKLRIDSTFIDNSRFKNQVVIDPANYIIDSDGKALRSMLDNNISSIEGLKRCSKCVLPETFPFIEFDDKGVCNYCNNYAVKDRKKRQTEFKNIISKYSISNGKQDCIVPFSGGRDSSYSIHYLVTELGMNPIAYTYDWGMVTDLARRNIARICGKLGIEHIIVAADIWKKRKYIRNNIIAWLKKPELGMVPLFMSGDKSFFYYLNRLQQQTGILLNIWGENYLEKTDFKTGFAGIPPEFNKKRIYSMSILNSIQFLEYMAKSAIKNPAYINSSLMDNIKGQFSRSLMKKTAYYNFYDFYEWEESLVVDTIVKEYDWEFAIDTKSSWRIGDGTSAFYNYIYYTVAGFSEFDTFRSNQVREGQITRDYAINVLPTENIVRYETLRWYLEIIGLDFETVIKRINEIPKHYNYE